jgi:hypothetical protein
MIRSFGVINVKDWSCMAILITSGTGLLQLMESKRPFGDSAAGGAGAATGAGGSTAGGAGSNAGTTGGSTSIGFGTDAVSSDIYFEVRSFL